jgi:hypothetical protein
MIGAIAHNNQGDRDAFNQTYFGDVRPGDSDFVPYQQGTGHQSGR